jgi:tyrosyl-tRNA synthetase
VLHPKKAKVQLAHTIVAGFHGEDAAGKAADEFDLVYSKRQLPSEMQEQEYTVQDGKIKLSRVITGKLALAKSGAEAERLITQGAVEWDGKRITDPTFSVRLDEPGSHTLRVGKKPAVRVIIKPS